MLFEGRYILRVPSPIAHDGQFATGENEVDGPVTVADHGSHLIGRQIWNIKPVEGKKNVYTINLWSNGSVFGGSFSPKNVTGNPVGPIVTSQNLQEWSIIPVDHEISGIYHIVLVREKMDIVGATWYAGTQGKDVVVKAIPVVQFPENPPAWVIRKLNFS